jgi:hypothetical protein
MVKAPGGCLPGHMPFCINPKNESKVTGYVLSKVFNIGAIQGKDAVIAVIPYEIRNYVIG